MANHRTTVLTSAIDAIHAMQEVKGSSAKSIKDFMKTYPITGVPTRVQSSTLIKVLDMAVKDDILHCDNGRYKIASKTLLQKLQLDDATKRGGNGPVTDVVVDACRRKHKRSRRARRRSCRRRRRSRRRRHSRRRCGRRSRRRRSRRRRRSCRKRRRSRRRGRRSRRRRSRRGRRSRRRRSRRHRSRRRHRSCRKRHRHRSKSGRRHRRRSSGRRHKRRHSRHRRRHSCRRRRRHADGDENEDASERPRGRRSNGQDRKPDDVVRRTRRSHKDKMEGDAPPSPNQQTNEMGVKGQRRRRGPPEEIESNECNTMECDQPPPPSVASGTVVCEERSQ